MTAGCSYLYGFLEILFFELFFQGSQYFKATRGAASCAERGGAARGRRAAASERATTGGARNAEAGRGEGRRAPPATRPRRAAPARWRNSLAGGARGRRRFAGRIEGLVVARWIGAVGRREIGRRGRRRVRAARRRGGSHVRLAVPSSRRTRRASRSTLGDASWTWTADRSHRLPQNCLRNCAAAALRNCAASEIAAHH